MAVLLKSKASIPQIKAKLPILEEIHIDAFWDANDILLFEKVRKELRNLIRFWMKVEASKSVLSPN